MNYDAEDEYFDGFDGEGFGADDDAIRALFGEDVNEIVWRERIDDVAPEGAAFVDVVVSSQKGAILKTDRKVALGYFPNGPVVKGIQNYSEGQTLGFYKVPVKPGAELVLVADSDFLHGSLAANVVVTASGGGEGKVNEGNAKQGNPLDALAGNLGTGLAVIVGVLVLLELLKGELRS